MRRRWLLWGALALLACCGSAPGETRVEANLYEGQLCVYEGDRLIRQQPLVSLCHAPPVGSWAIERMGEGYRVDCPWGEYRLEDCGELPPGSRLQVLGPVEEYQALRPGARGAGVFRLQVGLRALGYLDQEPSGLYDARTAAAVCACFGGQEEIFFTGQD